MSDAGRKKAIAVASDHAGLHLKQKLGEELSKQDFAVLDLGPQSDESVDYPDFAQTLVEAIKNGQADRGVLICGSGIGMSIAANRHDGIRAALCSNAETARLARQHNDANVLVLGERMIGEEEAKECLRVFLSTEFEGGRHARRVAKLG